MALTPAELLSVYTTNSELSNLLESDKFGIVSLKSFGVIGDGVTDDTVAIQKACDFAFANNLKLIGFGGTCLISSTINILCNCDLSMVNFYADGTSFSPVIRAGYNTSGTKLNQTEMKLPSVYNYKNGTLVTNWTNSNIAIELGNANQCLFNIKRIEGFNQGLVCMGYDQGFAYNRVELQIINYCKVCITLNKSGTGWCNENLFINGRLFCRSATGSTLAADWIGTRAILITNGNNNVFLKPSVESDYSEYSMEFITGSYNQIIAGRYEGAGAKKIYFNPVSNNSCNSMLFIGGYQAYALTFTYNGLFTSAYNAIISGRGDNKVDAIVASESLSLFNTSQLLAEGSNQTDWLTRIDKTGIYAKFNTETPAISMTTLGRLFFGDTLYLRDYEGLRVVNGNVHSGTDNTYSLGTASNKWSVVYAGNGTINTSDEREKDYIDTIPDLWLEAWADVQWARFKFKDAIVKKGVDGARWHLGLIAQRVKVVFESHGINPFEIGLLCYDEWQDEYEEEDENGNIVIKQNGFKNRYGIRYDEAFVLECAYQRRELERLKQNFIKNKEGEL